MDSDLSGKAVIVLGASGQLGFSICTLLAAEGAHVFAQYRSNLKAAERLHAQLGATPIQADLTHESEVAALFARCESLRGPLEGCVIASGMRPAQPTQLADMSLELWREFCDANLLMTFLCAREYLRSVRASGVGSMVLLGSTSGAFGNAGRAQFAAYKSAISVGLLKSLAFEMSAISKSGRVNSVSPGAVQSSGESMPSEERERALATSAMEKFSSPEDVARAVVWLLSPALSGSVTGQDIRVDAGMSGRLRDR